MAVVQQFTIYTGFSPHNKGNDMKPKQKSLIIRIFRNPWFKLILVDLILYLLFKYYQPLCEPCLEGVECPPCLSEEQYFILYLGIAINTIFLIVWLFKKIKKHP